MALRALLTSNGIESSLNVGEDNSLKERAHVWAEMDRSHGAGPFAIHVRP